MFENIFGKLKEKRTQLHFRDDGTFEFRRLEIEDTFLVEKKNDEIIKGWKHFYRNQFPFAGYKGIRSDQVTLSYDRDIILDPYNLVGEDKDNPEMRIKVVLDAVDGDKELKGTRAWLSDIGEARRLKMLANRAKSSSYNKVIMFLGVALLVELLIIGFLVLGKQG